MIVQVKKLEQETISNKPKFHRSDIFIRRWQSNLHDQVFSCKCYHMYCGHHLCTGKCGYDNCHCLEFSPIEIVFRFKVYEEIKVEEYKGGLF